MTDIVNPSRNAEVDSFKLSQTIKNAATTPGYIKRGSDPTAIAEAEPNIDQTQLNSFEITTSSSSLDATIDPGEAFVEGSYVARDTTTTVSIASNSTETVYVGWDDGATNATIIGTADDFSIRDPKIAIFDVTTDGSGVTSISDRREIGQNIDVESVKASGVSVDDWNFVDVVKSGVDNTGTDSVSDQIESLAGDNTFLFFPPGTYYLGSTLNLDGYTNLWLKGNGATMYIDTNSTLDGSDPQVAVSFGGSSDPATDCVWSGIDGDVSQATDKGARWLGITHTGSFRVERMEGIGVMQGDGEGKKWIEVLSQEEDSTFVAEDVRMTDGSTVINDTDPNYGNASGIRLAPSPGTKWAINCVAKGFESPGIVARWNDANDGPAHIRGGVYGDCNRAGVRIGPPGSTVIGTQIENNTEATNGSTRGIWVYEGTAQTVRGVTIHQNVDGASAIRVSDPVGTATIENVDIRHQGDYHAISTSDGADKRTVDPEYNKLTIRDVDIRGDGTTTNNGILVQRPNARIIDCVVRLKTGSENAIRVGGDNSEIIRPDVESGNRPIYVANSASGVNIRDILSLNTIDTGWDIDLQYASDVDLQGDGFTNRTILEAPITRYEGIIGGGPLGGVDLGSTSGQFTGDRAMADGTTATNAYGIWQWDGTNWQFGDGTSI